MIIIQDKIKLKFPVDERGKITTGLKGSKDKKGVKKSLDYFRIDEFEELTAVYGMKPTKLLLYFPPGAIEDYFQFYYCEWGKNNKAKRRCNREVFNVTFDHDGMNKNEEYECEFPSCNCKPQVYFNAFIGNPQNGRLISNFGKTYLFRTGSHENGQRIYTALKMKEGMIFGQAYILSVNWITDGDKAYPSWMIEPRHHLNRELESTTIGGLLEQDNSPVIQITEGKEKTVLLESAKEEKKESPEQKLMHDADEIVVKIRDLKDYEDSKNKIAVIYKKVSQENQEKISIWMNNAKKRIDEDTKNEILGV